jgi:hypothetical protein
MNYIIEDNIDFFSELKKELDESNKEKKSENKNDNENESENDYDICLITHEPLIDNHITLSCNHKFNYLPLYLEVVNQKTKHSYLEITRLKLNEIKCPYCRTITPSLIPYINFPEIKRIYGVNSPQKHCLKLHSCEWTKRDNSICGKDAYKTETGTFCNTHHSMMNKKTMKKSEDISEWTELHNELNKKYNIPALKDILRSNKKRVGGTKRDLINRIINNNLL